ncbi:MAG: flagellar motor switch protein FliN [Gammaproteobacteria bacterium]|nr:flagellar motor switch protein FliN [Gammaproteobacteria bacterium]
MSEEATTTEGAEEASAAASAHEDAAAAATAPAAAAGDGVSHAAMQDLEPDALTASGEPANLESILDIPVMLAVEIGSTRISIRNLLQLNQGSVVELDRLAGEPLDVLVNGTLVAHGEVVVVNEKFGIRLTDVISAQERVKKLT